MNISGASPLPLTMRSAITGALTGSALSLLIGLALYSNGLNFPFMAGLFNHAFALRRCLERRSALYSARSSGRLNSGKSRVTRLGRCDNCEVTASW